MKLEPFSPRYIIADSGYKTPAIAHYLLERNIIPVFLYTRTKGVKGNLRASDFVYDAYYDCYLCPENQVLSYRTTSREGYREYKSDPKVCSSCPILSVCTQSQKSQKSNNETCMER